MGSAAEAIAIEVEGTAMREVGILTKELHVALTRATHQGDKTGNNATGASECHAPGAMQRVEPGCASDAFST
jgi:hypothetical protein